MDFVSRPFVLLFLLLSCSQFTADAEDIRVNPTELGHKGAVCLSGIPAAYYFAPGSDEGVHNWVVFLPGGGWCSTMEGCVNYTQANLYNQTAGLQNFSGILSNDKTKNPDFFNWNKVMIRYCDGSSFTGNSKKIYDGTKLYFKGARIFQTTLKVMLKKGMKSAKNALLVGESSGGVAVMLHCDRFRQKFSSSTHVKCLSDGGYFFAPAKKHNFWSRSFFVSTFEGVVNLHRPTKMLPKSCTSKFSPAMCFFAQNVQKDIKTPIFFIMSEFDYIEIAYTTGKSYIDCVNYKNCTSDEIKVMQDLRLELLDILPEQDNHLSRGFLILSSFGHVHTLYSHWYEPAAGTNKTMANMFGDWYFDRKVVQIIEKCDDPYICQ